MANKNKNKLPAASAAGGAASASAAAQASPAPRAAQAATHTAPRTAPAAAAAGAKGAKAKPSSTSTAAPAASTPAPAAARPSLVVDDDDSAPLPRGVPRKPAAAAAGPSASSHAPSAALPSSSSSTSDAPPTGDDVLFGNRRGAKEEARAAKAAATAAKKRKAGDAAAPTGKKGKHADGDEEEATDLFTGATASANMRHLSDPLSHSSLRPGMLLLGAVRAVNEVDLTVQLPHGLTGYVSMREVSDTIAAIVDKYIEQGEAAEAAAASAGAGAGDDAAPAPTVNLPNLSDFIQVGQLVHCTILSVGENSGIEGAAKTTATGVSTQKSRRIEISLRAALFNQHLSLASLTDGRMLVGSVKSVQEKGYLIDVGIAGNNQSGAANTASGTDGESITAFLPFTKAPADLLLPAAKRTGRPSIKKEGESGPAARRLPVGMPITTLITSAANKRVLLLNADPAAVNAAVMRNASSAQVDATTDAHTALAQSIGFTNLQPGMLVRAEIISVITPESAAKNNSKSSGLYVRFLDFFHAIIDTLHASSDASIAGALESLFRPGQKIAARILHINFVAKKVALSALPHVVACEPFVFPKGVRAGDRIMNSIVTKVEPKQGVYLRLPIEAMEGTSIDKERQKRREEKEQEKAAKEKEKQQERAARKAIKQEEGDDDEDMEPSDDEEDEKEDEKEEGDDESDEDVSEEISLSAWAHLSRLTDSHITSVPKSMSVGSTLPCRILNFHYLDGLVHVSTQPHILAQSILYYEDVQADMEVSGEVVSVESFGVLLKLTPHITALIPALHLSDVLLSDPSKKFKVGQTLKARVLYADGGAKKIVCTMKKSLLGSVLPRITSYMQATPGTISHGYINSVKDYGLIVEFYNQTHGLVPVGDLVRSGFLKEGQSPSQSFKRGQVHKVRVVHTDVKKQRMKLSLGLVAPVKIEGETPVDPAQALLDELAAPGRIVAATVKEVQKDALLLALDAEEDDAAAKKKAKKPAAKAEHLVLLPQAQLSDHPSLVAALLKSYPVGHRFDRLLVLHKDKSSKMHIVSAKASLLATAAAAGSDAFSIPSSYDALQPGQLLLGCVRRIAEFGVFVEFLDHVSALAPRAMLADSFLAGDLSAFFSVGQTVRAKVVSVEHKEGESHPRLTVTLKPSQIFEAEEADKKEELILGAEDAFTRSYFQQAVQAGLIPAKPEHPSPVVAAPAAAEAGKKRKAAAATPALTRGSSVAVRVEKVHSKWVELSLPAHSDAYAYAMATSTNLHVGANPLFTVGQELRARVLTVPSSADERMLVVLDLDAAVAASKAGGGVKKKTSDLTFVDPSIGSLADLQNGRKLQVRIKGLVESSKGARLEVEIAAGPERSITARVHVSELEEPLHVRAAAGDKAAKTLLKAHASKAYLPLAAWGARVGEVVPARIMSIVRKTTGVKGAKAKKKTHISAMEVSLRPATIERAHEGEAPLAHTSASDLKQGELLQCFVKDVEVAAADASDKGTIWAVVSPGIKARIRCNELSFPKDDKAAQKQLSDLAASFQSGQALTTQILDVHTDRHLVDLVLLPLGTTKPKTLDAALVERVKATAAAARQESHELKTGSIVHNLTVRKILPGVGLIVSFTKQQHSASGAPASHEKLARIHITDLSDEWTNQPLDAFHPQQKLPSAYVLSVRAKEEEVYKGVQADEEDGAAEEQKSAASGSHHHIDLSLRKSHLAPKGAAGVAVSAAASKFPELLSFDSLVGREGQFVSGYVKSTSKAGCFVWLSHSIVARCLLKNLSDSFVTDIHKQFPQGKLLKRVRILSVDPKARTVEVSLRKGDGSKSGVASESAQPDGTPLYSFDSLSVGDTVKGYVTQVKPFGVFIKLKQSPLSGLCHISEVSDQRIKDLAEHYEVGDKVRARVVKKDEEARKISLGLKAKYFEDMEPDSEAEEEQSEDDEAGDSDEDEMHISDEEEEEEVAKPAAKKAAAKGAKGKKAVAAADESDDEEESSRPSKKARSSPAATASSASASAIPAIPGSVDDVDMADAPALDLNTSFSMLISASATASAAAAADSDASDLDDEDDDDATGASAAKKKSRRAKSASKKAEERNLLVREQAILDPTAQPESAEDYERLLVQDPNASMVWIKYMAFQISLTEVDAARKIAERALKSISFRHAQEKLNVWVALLNLENMYGSAQSVKEVATRASQYNDPLTVALELAKIFAATNKVEQCIETYEAALKKFHAHPSIWLAYGTFLYSVPARIPEARELLKRALARLDKHEHVALLVKWAQLEFHVARNVDRGRTLLEGVMSTYPKRVDLWNVYVDMELKLLKSITEASGSAPAASLEPLRRLLDRITSLSLSTKKMKFFFQKYLAFEKAQGGADPARIEAIKNKARAFVAGKSAQGDE